ncbi:transposase [Edaphobacter aggregans]|uniref:transposase n=1 Tax=Edaphobacter aggregans TaxID=570835 RepID=UPI000F74709A
MIAQLRSWCNALVHRTRIDDEIVEPVFGQIKERRGFRRFSFRGRVNVQAEWKLICLTHNLLKLFRFAWTPISRLRPQGAPNPMRPGKHTQLPPKLSFPRIRLPLSPTHS